MEYEGHSERSMTIFLSDVEKVSTQSASKIAVSWFQVSGFQFRETRKPEWGIRNLKLET